MEDEREYFELPIHYSYPNSPDFEFHTKLDKINLDKEREHDILTGNGFIITSTKSSLKSNMKNPNGIFSTKFGQTLGDLNPYMDRYRCKCGSLKFHINHGIRCDKCGAKVEFVDDNFEYFAYLVLIDDYYVIHPNLYKSIEYFLGGVNRGKNTNKKSKLENIITVQDDRDMNGFTIENEKKPKDEPFFGIGMIEFQKRFDEIMDYYLKKNPQKRDVYEDIMNFRDCVFTHSIPVFTTLLRPMDINNNSMSYESTNGLYTIMNTLVTRINRNKTRADKEEKPKNEKLCKLQLKFNELYSDIEKILAGKKGQLRILIGGRYTFTARSVITSEPYLKIDEVKLSYYALLVLLEQRIINILCKTYNILVSEAKMRIDRAKIIPDKDIRDIILALIKSHSSGRGLPIVINRNPTIGYGSILQMYCIGIVESYTMAIPLQILPLMAADFDGDVENILECINKAFAKRAAEIFNPANVMYISRNDGKLNTDVMHQRDTMIISNTLVHVGRRKYSEEQLAQLRKIKEMNKNIA